jgi:alpha-glucosidase (family GH31 glycosyl hydrolase)
MLMKKLISVTLFFFYAYTGLVWAQENKHIIKINNHKFIQIEPYTDRIIRIRVSDHKDFPETLMERYGIIKTDWNKTEFSTENKNDKKIITTNSFKILTDKKTGSISVKDLKGRTIIDNISFLDDHDKTVSGLRKSLNSKFKKTKRGTGIIGDTGSTAEKKDRKKVKNINKNSVISFSLKKDERFYGGGSTSRDHVQHRGEALRMWATYQIAEVPVPFMMSSDGWGIFNNTTQLNFFDIGRFDKNKMFLYNTTGDTDLYLMLGESMDEVIDLYTTVTGKPYLLPKYMYGLAFGGNTIEDQMDIMDDAYNFRNEEIPCDLFWIEPQWMEKYYDFSTSKDWDFDKFPGEKWWNKGLDIKRNEYNTLFIHKLHELGFKLGLWLCIDHDLSIAEEDQVAENKGTKLSGKEHWFDHLTKFIDEGVDGFKLDPGHTLNEHPDRKYYNGYTDREMHNLNQVLLQKQMELTYRNYKGIRSYHHYCGGYAGAQHWGALNSGDNGGGRIALFDQINLGLSGLMNTSCDVMEVEENNLAAMHMGFFLPWVQVNSWYGLLHPWYLPPEEKEAFRFYSQLRYDLIPYIYSTAINGTLTGKSIVRAMALEFPDDRNTDDLTFQYMFGDHFLVGVSSDSVYLPKGNWIDFWTGEKIRGGRTVKSVFPKNRGGSLFIRSGAIIPCQEHKQYITTGFYDTLILKIYPEGRTSYTLLEDDGISYQYENGIIARTEFICNEQKDKITFSIALKNDHYKKELENRRYEMQMFCDKPKKVILNGITQKEEDWKYNNEQKLLTFSFKTNSKKTVKLDIIK